MTNVVIHGRCDCGAVRWAYRGVPRKLTLCNCGYCRRASALWAYGNVRTIHIEGETVPYLRAERSLEFHHCPTCGVVTHWQSVTPEGTDGHGRRAANMRLADLNLILGLPIERLDGADTWRSLEPHEQAEVPFLPL